MNSLIRLTPKWLFSLVAALVLVAGLSVLGNAATLQHGTALGVIAVLGAMHVLSDLPRMLGLVERRSLFVLGPASDLLIYPRLADVSDAAGCSLTRTKFTPLTADIIQGMDMTAYSEDIIARMVESRAVGVRQNTLMELLMSRVGNVKGPLAQRTTQRGTQFAPFKYRHRSRNMVMSQFNVTAGQASPGAGTGSKPASAWDLTINVGPGLFATQFKNLGRFFLPGHYIEVEWKNVSTEVAYNAFLKVFAVEDIDENSTRVTVVAPFSSNAAWNAATTQQKAPYKPTFGAVTVLANNVSDWESFCTNAPTTNNKELVIDWFQTSRETRCRNKEYEEMLSQILDGNVNPYLQKFRHLDVAERNRQEMAYWDQVWFNAIWFNGRISEAQKDNPTWEDIEALEVVADPEDPSCTYERKANALGIHTQLVENGRRYDMQGAAFDFDLFSELIYTIRRNRRLDSRPHEVIDLMVDRHMKAKLDGLLTRYLKADLGVDSYTRNVEQGKTLDSNGMVVFEYTVYDLPKQGFKVGLFSTEFLDDRLTNFTTGAGGSVNNRNRGRMMMAIDWEDILVGILETNTVQREYKNDITAQANPLYSCRMKLNTKTFDLRSKTWDVEFGDFERHMIVENFSDECPLITATPCNPALS